LAIKSILTNFESILIILYFVKLLGNYRREKVKTAMRNSQLKLLNSV